MLIGFWHLVCALVILVLAWCVLFLFGHLIWELISPLARAL